MWRVRGTLIVSSEVASRVTFWPLSVGMERKTTRRKRNTELEHHTRPNPYVDDTRGKIVIYSWNLVARKEKSGKRGISSRLVEGKKFLEPFSVTFPWSDEKVSVAFS